MWVTELTAIEVGVPCRAIVDVAFVAPSITVTLLPARFATKILFVDVSTSIATGPAPTFTFFVLKVDPSITVTLLLPLLATYTVFVAGLTEIAEGLEDVGIDALTTCARAGETAAHTSRIAVSIAARDRFLHIALNRMIRF